MEHAGCYQVLGVELGVDVSKGRIEDDEDISQGYRQTVRIELEGYNSGGGRVVVRGWGQVAGGVSTTLAMRPLLDSL